MESRDADAFVTAWAPEPEVVIDLVAVAEEDEEIRSGIGEGEIKAMRADVKALREALERSSTS